MTETARVADQGGVDLVTVMDHWLQVKQFGGLPGIDPVAWTSDAVGAVLPRFAEVSRPRRTAARAQPSVVVGAAPASGAAGAAACSWIFSN